MLDYSQRCALGVAAALLLAAMAWTAEKEAFAQDVTASLVAELEAD